MVAIHRTAESRADGDQEQRVARVEHANDDRQNKRDGAPARAHRKADECRNQENSERQQSQAYAQAIQEAAHERARTDHVTAYAAERPSEHENHNGPNHGAHAFGNAFHVALKRAQAARQIHGSSNDQRHERTDAQASNGILANGGREIDALEEAAHIQHAPNGEYDQNENRHNEVEHLALLGHFHSLELGLGLIRLKRLGELGLFRNNGRRQIVRGLRVILRGDFGGSALSGNAQARIALDLVGIGNNLAQVCGSNFLGLGRTILRSSLFGLLHGAKVQADECNEEHEYDSAKRIEVIRNRLHEQVEAVIAQVAANGNSPRRHRGNNAHRRRARVDKPCELFVAHAEAVGDRTHNRANREAVEVVVHENENAQNGGHHAGEASALHVLRNPCAICARATGNGDEYDKRAQQRQEQQQRAVVGNLLTHHLGNQAERVNERTEPNAIDGKGIDDHANENSDCEGGIHLLRKKRQTKRQKWGHNRPYARVNERKTFHYPLLHKWTRFHLFPKCPANRNIGESAPAQHM